MSKGIVSIHRNREETKPFSLCITVHDSIVVQTAVKDVKDITSYLVDQLEQKHQVGTYNISFPVDVEAGFSYGYMIPIEVWEQVKNPTREKVEKYCKMMKTEEFLKLSVEDRLRRL